MNIAKAGYGIIPETDSLIKKIELVARTCYKSEDLITEDSAVKMVGNLINRQHFAMLEHASLAFEVDGITYSDLVELVTDLEQGKIEKEIFFPFKSYLRFSAKDKYIVSGNIRAWIEFLDVSIQYTGTIPAFFSAFINTTEGVDIEVLFGKYKDTVGSMYVLTADYVTYERIEDFSVLSNYERLIHEDISIKFCVDRGVTHELVRMRDCSFAQESTRYCNYGKGKFGNEVTVIEPCFWEPNSYEWTQWKMRCEQAEQGYFDLMATDGVTAQQARDVLPTSVKADIIMTTNINEWIHILELRALGTTGQPHPQMLEFMIPLAKELAETKLSDFSELESVAKMRLL